MDVDRIEAMDKQWRKEPPVGLLVAAYLGYKPPEPVKASKGGVAELLKMFPKGEIR